LLEGVLGSSTDAILFLLPDGTITEWSASARKMYGWSRREALGQAFAMLFPADFAIGLAAKMLAAALAAGQARRTTIAARKDGSRFYVEITVAAVSRPAREPRGFVLVVRDVTEPTLVHAASAAVAADLDTSAALTSFFEVLAQVLPLAQLSLSVVDGRHYRCVATAGAAAREPVPGQRVPLGGNAIGGTVMTRRPVVVADVRRRRFVSDARLDAAGIASYVVLPLFQSGKVFGALKAGFAESGAPTKRVVALLESVIASVAPMVANLLIFEEQAGAIRNLERLDQLRNDFLALIAHDIQTPLSVIGGHGELLRKCWDELADWEKLDSVDAIIRNARSLRHIADRALQVARIESGFVANGAGPLDLAAHVRRMVDDLDASGARRRIRVFLEDDLPLVSVDPDAHWHIFSNLLANAMKFSAPEAQIDVEVSCRSDRVHVAVRDRGMGIGQDALPKLFHKFSRVTAPEQLTVRGTGLGLFICRTLVEAYGGSIWVESARGSGSTFTYALPVADGRVPVGGRTMSAVDEQPVAVSERDRFGPAVHVKL
jgi:PAS domain S-box-containing protein